MGLQDLGVIPLTASIGQDRLNRSACTNHVCEAHEKWHTRREAGPQSHGTPEVSRVAEGIYIDVLGWNQMGQRPTRGQDPPRHIGSPASRRPGDATNPPP